MKALWNQKGLRRFGALLLAALLALCQMGGLTALAEMPPSPLAFTLYWGDQAAQAEPVTVPGYETTVKGHSVINKHTPGPKTGDDSRTGLYVALAGGSLVAAGALFIGLRRRKKG